MLTWTPFIEHAPIAQETTDVQQCRHDLEIRSLLEFPALRVVMGLDAPAVDTIGPDSAATMTDLASVVNGGQPRKRQPKRTPKAAAAPRANTGSATRTSTRTTTRTTTHTTTHTSDKAHPRFDRRALLETDRVA